MTSFTAQPTSPGLMRLRGTLAEQKAALEIGSGSVATDAIWDVAGDLAVGTGLDTAARLARGTALQVLHVNAAGTTVEYVGSSGTGSVMRADGPTYSFVKTTEVNNVISANASTITLASGNHQTLTLAAATASVTVTLTPPSSAAAGTLVLLQDDAARDVTWASTATILWAGTQPTWASDVVSSYRVISWRYDGTRLFLAATNVFTANS